MSPRRAPLALALLLAAPALGDVAPRPPDQATCRFKTVHALAGGDGSMDPRITMLREDLQKPPFTAWKTFRVLGDVEKRLSAGESASIDTPDGRTATLTYLGHDERGGKHAVRGQLGFRGEKSDTRTAFTLDEGGHLVVAGHKHQGGILIYAITCKTGS